MQRAVRGQEGDLRLKRPPASARLPPGLAWADHDVPETKDAVRVCAEVQPRLGAADPARQPLAEGEDVRRPVDPAVLPVEVAHLGVVHERENDLALARKSERTERSADGSADRGEVARRLAGDGDAHRAT